MSPCNVSLKGTYVLLKKRGIHLIDHDRLFKMLIETFFEEFMVLFLPEAAELIDFSQVTFLQQEVFSDLIEGEKKVVDLLVETKLHEEDGMILIHVEPQSHVQPNFNERMYLYHNRLYEKHRKRILPVAIFSYDEKKQEPDHFALRFPFLDVSYFRYVTIELNQLPWRQYIRQDNPVAAALLSKMGYNKDERIQVKKEFLRMLVRLELDPARMELLTGFFETYLKLTFEEEQELVEEIHMLDSKEEGDIMELMTSWEKKGIEKGMEQGLEKGVSEEKQATAKRMLQDGWDTDMIAKYTELSEEQVQAIKEEMEKKE